MNSAVSDEEDTMVLVTLLTGANATIDAVEALTVEGGVVSEDEDDNEDRMDIEGGPEPADVV